MRIFVRILAIAALACGSGAAAAQTAPVYSYLPPVFGSGNAADRAGSSVSRDGEWLAVGVPGHDDDGAADSGRVGIYRWTDGAWRALAPLRLGALDGESAQAGARFGASVSVSGSRVLIGCPGCSDGRAKAYLVDLQEPLFPAAFRKLFPPVIAEPDAELGIGAAVALSGGVFAVGAPLGRSTLAGVERGAVATGRIDGAGVAWEDILFGPESPAGSRFGHALALAATSGSVPLTGYRSLLIGAPAYVNSGGFGLAGRGYLYQRSDFGTGWDYRQEFANATPGLADAMGSSVAIQRTSAEVDGYLALGAPGRSVNGTPGGGAFIHVRAVGQNAYAFEALVQHPEAEAGDRFGSAVGIDGTRLAVGADGRARGPSFPDQGRVYVFDRQAPSGGAWPLRQELTFPGSGNVNLGRALSVALDMIVVGWPAQDFAASGGGAAIYACDLLFVDGLQGNTAARPCTRP